MTALLPATRHACLLGCTHGCMRAWHSRVMHKTVHRGITTLYLSLDFVVCCRLCGGGGDRRLWGHPDLGSAAQRRGPRCLCACRQDAEDGELLVCLGALLHLTF